MSEVTIRKYKSGDLPEMIAVWNEVVEGGVAFPQEEMLDSVGGEKFFAAQTYCGVAEVDGKVLGLYILHPNNIGRCGHICNASYAVSSKSRGQHIGEKLAQGQRQPERRTDVRHLQREGVHLRRPGRRRRSGRGHQADPRPRQGRQGREPHRLGP